MNKYVHVASVIYRIDTCCRVNMEQAYCERRWYLQIAKITLMDFRCLIGQARNVQRKGRFGQWCIQDSRVFEHGTGWQRRKERIFASLVAPEDEMLLCDKAFLESVSGRYM
jgi:hypothetical protein